MDHVLTIQAAQGQILVDVLDEIRGLRADLAWFWSSSSPPPFDNGFLLPFGILSQKGELHMSFAPVLALIFRERVYFLLVGACGVV